MYWNNSKPSLESRRAVLAQLGAAGLALAAGPARAETTVKLGLPGGAQERVLTTGFPEKGEMILQRTRPALLETPFAVFDRGVFTPNDQFYVRWHWAVIPAEVNVDTYRLAVRGHVNAAQTLSLQDLMAMPRVEIAAVNQCSGNSRGLVLPRVPGGEWSNGAMGNAKWVGVRLRDVLDRAGVKPGAQQVRFAGADETVVPDAPKFLKSLAIDHARDSEVMIAFAMNGAQLPLLNGFPLRLVVPGWYATYWIKALNDIEVLDGPDENFWMKTAYTVPDNPTADMKPGQTGVKMVPISRMVPRSFVTNLKDGDPLHAGVPSLVRGIAFGGAAAVKSVEVSTDAGGSWKPAELGPDEGKFGFRRWQTMVTAASGDVAVMVRCTNADGLVQPATANWNPSGFMRNVIETTHLRAA